MARRQVVAVRIATLVFAGISLLITLAVLVLTRTDWGRDRVRAFAVERLAGQVAGRVSIGRLNGNLISGATLAGVTIEDSAGAPFLAADTVTVRYSLRSFLTRQLVFRDIRLVRPVIVLNQRADGTWNFARLFPEDTAAAATAPGGTGGFGSVVRLENVSVRDGTMVVRSAAEPPHETSPRAGRPWIVRTEDGWQRLLMVHDLDAWLPLIRLADPDSAARVVHVDSARMTAFPARPPAAHVRALSGRLALLHDTVVVSDAALALPGTRLHGTGVYVTSTGALHGDIAAEALAFEDLRWLSDDLPAGGGTGKATVALTDGSMRIAAHELDVTVDSGRVRGAFDVQLGDTLRIGAADVAFENMDTRTVERLAGGDAVPVDGVATGAVRLAGSPVALDVTGWAELRERTGRVSRVHAEGVIGAAEDGGLRADGLTLRFEPLQASLVRQFRPELALTGAIAGRATVTGSTRTRLHVDADLSHGANRAERSRILADGIVEVASTLAARDLRIRFDPLRVATLESMGAKVPVGGTLRGTAVLNGAPSRSVEARLDLTHSAETGTSELAGTATWRAGGAFDLDIRLPVLALETVGVLAPAAGLQGSASGMVHAEGTLARMEFTLDLAMPDSGRIGAAGTLDRRTREPGYAVRADLAGLNAALASRHAPETRLSGRIDAEGRGTDPATLRATIAADLVDTHVAGAPVDTSQIRMTLAGGVASFERAHLRLASATADVEGALGLVEGATGELRYRIDVQSLSDFARYLPADTGMIPARPVTQARRMAAARADSARVAEETAVQRAATGLPAAPVLAVDSVRPLARDSVAGRIMAEGEIHGSIRRFDVTGTAEADRVVAAGTAVQYARASYELADFGTPDADLRLDAGADSLTTAGFTFDSAAARVRYRGVRNRGNGSLEVGVFQDPSRDYRVASEFLLELDRREMTFSELVMRFDSVRWSAPHPSALSWAGSGITLDSLELVSDAGDGRIAVDGRIATDAPGEIRMSVRDLPIGQIAAVLQDTLTATGLLDLDMEMHGTTAEPRFEGSFALDSASLDGRALPDIRAGFDYAGRVLRTDAQATQRGRPLLSARARLPIDLALTGVTGPRLLDRPLGIEARADSLPLEALPGLTDAVADVRGRVRGEVVVGGSWDAPILNGGVTLDLASLRIVPAGVFLTDLAGAVDLAGDAVTIDSLRARSGGGPIRVSGRLDVEQLARPTFDLTVDARDAVVYDTDRGTVRTDADLTIAGPLDSARIAGDVHVLEGVIMIPELGGSKRVAPLDDASVLPVVDSTKLDAEILPTPNPLLDNLILDVGVRIARDTWVRNSDLNVELYTPEDADPLRVRLNAGRPGLALDGVINADRGEYEFAGRVFDLSTGALTFLPNAELDPLLQLTANYEVARRGREALVIQIHLTGTLDQPRIALESTAEPPLSESDLLSYLAFGRATSSVLSMGDAGLTGGGNGVGGVGALAQQQLGSLALGTAVNDAVASLEQRGGRAFDVFRIHPAQLPDEFAFAGALENFLRGTEIVAGKYITTGLFVAAEGRTTTEAYPGLRVEWETANGFSWRTTWEPRYLPSRPSFDLAEAARTTRVLGTFLYWQRRF